MPPRDYQDLFIVRMHFLRLLMKCGCKQITLDMPTRCESVRLPF